MGLWAWALPPQLAAPLAVFGALLGQVASFASVRGGFDLRRIAPLVIGGALGVPIGVFLLHNADPLRFKLAIGALLALYGLYGLAVRDPPRVKARRRRRSTPFAGLVGGVLGGLGGMSGAVPAIWTQLRGWKRELRRATMQVYNIAMQVLTLAAYARTGALDAGALRLFAVVAPAMLIPAFLGARLFPRVSERGFERLALVLLVASGLGMLVSAGRTLGGGDARAADGGGLRRIGLRRLGLEAPPRPPTIDALAQGRRRGRWRLKVIEMAKESPDPFAGMLRADMGAEVARFDRRPSQGADRVRRASGRFPRPRPMLVALDLKRPETRRRAGADRVGGDALIECFRPGVMERLGLGPEVCLSRNPRRSTAASPVGDRGPLAQAVGHDIDYIALTGALHAIGGKDAPAPPLNLLGDYGGGALFLAFGVVSALLEARASGRGQVVDAAITDGVGLMMATTYSLKARGYWRDQRGTNALDGGAPFYGVYRCADGKWVAVGALEARFFAALVAGLGLEAGEFADRWNPRLGRRCERRDTNGVFAERTRDEWVARFAGADACVAPALDLDEAPRHPHAVARAAFVAGEGGPQPARVPRFSRTTA